MKKIALPQFASEYMILRGILVGRTGANLANIAKALLSLTDEMPAVAQLTLLREAEKYKGILLPYRRKELETQVAALGGFQTAVAFTHFWEQVDPDPRLTWRLTDSTLLLQQIQQRFGIGIDLTLEKVEDLLRVWGFRRLPRPHLFAHKIYNHRISVAYSARTYFPKTPRQNGYGIIVEKKKLTTLQLANNPTA